MLTFDQCAKMAQQIFVVGSFEDFSLNQLIDLLITADDVYTNDGETFMTDGQYDALKRYAHGLNPSHIYFTGIGSAVRGGKVKLPYKMGSLTQAYEGDITKWITKHNVKHDEFIVTEKLDGISVMIVYGEGGRLQIAYSRGDGVEGADITRHISKIGGVPTRVAEREPMVIRAEIIISKENFEIVKMLVKSRSGQQYKNARNMIAGLMNAESNPEIVYKYIDVVAYEVINSKQNKKTALDSLRDDNDFVIPRYVVIKGSKVTDASLTEILNEFRDESGYDIDGIVIEIDSRELREKINPSKDTLNPEYARKYKVADSSNYAEPAIIDIEMNVSKDGYVKPVLVFTPVDLVGATISRCTGFNMKFIRDNEIQPGARISLVRSGDTIPFCQGVAAQGPLTGTAYDDWFEQFVTGEVGDVEWNDTCVDLVVTDAKNHETAKFESLLDFFGSIDAPHLREGNLQTIFDAGFETPESVIELTQEDFSSLLNSQINGKKVFQGLRNRLTNIPMYDLMGSHDAFGRGIGKRKMKKLYEAFEGDMTQCQNFDRVVSVEGFDKKTATKVVNGYPKFVEFFESIRKYVTIAVYEEKVQGKMTGQTVVFTGFRSKELEKAVEGCGGKMGTSVSGKTTLVVAESKDSSSGKAVKARELGIKVIGVDELNQMLDS